MADPKTKTQNQIDEMMDKPMDDVEGGVAYQPPQPEQSTPQPEQATLRAKLESLAKRWEKPASATTETPKTTVTAEQAAKEAANATGLKQEVVQEAMGNKAK